MNIKIFAIAGILGMTIPTAAISKPAFNFEKIELETDKRQDILEDSNNTEEDSDRIELNSEEINPKTDKRSRTLELEEADNNCYTTKTNTSAGHNTFEGSCDWGF